MPSVAPPSPPDRAIDDLLAAIAADDAALRAIRHDLHAHPELAYDEHRTSEVVQRTLRAAGVPFVAGLAGGTGVLAHLPAVGPSAREGAPAVGLRADMDALPIEERTGVAWASRTPGRMHACGHDGHTTILLGAARALAAAAERPNPVTFVFQPAEEGGGGAERLCAEGVLDGGLLGPPVGRMFGLHGWPTLELGHVATRPGALLASTDEFNVTVQGVQAHAAYPHFSRDPVLAAAHCVAALQSLVARAVSPVDSAVVSVTTLRAGTASNIIPEQAHFGGTLRTLRDATRAALRQRLDECVRGVASGFGCRAEVRWDEGYPVTRNDAGLTEHFFSIARGALGAARVELVEHPTMGGEDFAYYARRVPSVFYCLGLRPAGAERYPTLHQPDFDFNDDAIATGVAMMCRLALAAPA